MVKPLIDPVSRWDWERFLRSEHSPVKGIDQHILFVMATWANEGQGWRMWPSVKTLAAATGYSEDRVRKARREGCKQVCLHRTGEMRGTAGKMTAVFQFALPIGRGASTDPPAAVDDMEQRLCRLAGLDLARIKAGQLDEAERLRFVNAKTELFGYHSLNEREQVIRRTATGS